MDVCATMPSRMRAHICATACALTASRSLDKRIRHLEFRISEPQVYSRDQGSALNTSILGEHNADRDGSTPLFESRHVNEACLNLAKWLQVIIHDTK